MHDYIINVKINLPRVVTSVVRTNQKKAVGIKFIASPHSANQIR